MATFNFSSRNQIIDLINETDNLKDTYNLIQKIEKLKKERTPLYLNKPEFEEILIWKLRTQYARQRKYREKNTNEIIQKITRTAFEIKHADWQYETELKLNILIALRGVGVPVASAILTLCYPEKYAVIDFRIVRQLFGKPKTNFPIRKYLEYLNTIRNIAKKYEVTPQQVDMAIWQYDIKMNG
jgi:thermostable 8-oxoguanine DNA glycosylase